MQEVQADSISRIRRGPGAGNLGTRRAHRARRRTRPAGRRRRRPRPGSAAGACRVPVAPDLGRRAPPAAPSGAGSATRPPSRGSGVALPGFLGPRPAARRSGRRGPRPCAAACPRTPASSSSRRRSPPTSSTPNTSAASRSCQAAPAKTSRTLASRGSSRGTRQCSSELGRRRVVEAAQRPARPGARRTRRSRRRSPASRSSRTRPRGPRARPRASSSPGPPSRVRPRDDRVEDLAQRVGRAAGSRARTRRPATSVSDALGHRVRVPVRAARAGADPERDHDGRHRLAVRRTASTTEATAGASRSVTVPETTTAMRPSTGGSAGTLAPRTAAAASNSSEQQARADVEDVQRPVAVPVHPAHGHTVRATPCRSPGPCDVALERFSARERPWF